MQLLGEDLLANSLDSQLQVPLLGVQLASLLDSLLLVHL